MLDVHRIRALTIDPHAHPRGLPHLSAASGLVCAHQRVYVVADDEHHLAVFCDAASPGELHRVFAGDLPARKPVRKRLKPDLEALFLLPAGRARAGAALVTLGSGSRPNRDTGVVVPLATDGQPLSEAARHFSLKPLYDALREVLGPVNIEGAMVLGDELVLLNRGVAGGCGNLAAHYPLNDLVQLIDGKGRGARLVAIRRHDLGTIDDVALGFTDCVALPDGGWVFSAVAEDTADSYADGHCLGSAIGVVNACGDVVALHRLASPAKVEGIAVQAGAGGMTVCMVTDADDPAQSAWLLWARL